MYKIELVEEDLKLLIDLVKDSIKAQKVIAIMIPTSRFRAEGMQDHLEEVLDILVNATQYSS